MKPILFNTEMVRAILDGRKMQTRRIVKPRHGGHLELHDDVGGVTRLCERDGTLCRGLKPPYEPGDILWARETWAVYSRNYGEAPRLVYKADMNPPDCVKWHPSIHMPKEAARLFLRVTDVRVERLQDITNADCVSEGAVKRPNMTKRGDLVLHNRYRKEFGELWDSTIKAADRDRYGWAANPWVWVISFDRYDPADPDGGADG